MAKTRKRTRPKREPFGPLYKASLAYVKRIGGKPIIQGGVSIFQPAGPARYGVYYLGIRFEGGPVPHFEDGCRLKEPTRWPCGCVKVNPKDELCRLHNDGWTKP